MPVLQTRSCPGAEFDRNAAAHSDVLEQLRDRHRHFLRGGIVIGIGIGIVSAVPCMIIANDATVKSVRSLKETVKKHLRARNRLREQAAVPLSGGLRRRLPAGSRIECSQQCRMSAAGLRQLSTVFGAATAGGAYIPALGDEVVMVRGSGRIHLGDPPIVKAAIKEVVDGKTLGGADMHTNVSGFADYLAETELGALHKLRDIVAALNLPATPAATAPGPPTFAQPGRPRRGCRGRSAAPYDVREVLARIVDGSEFEEFNPGYGSTLVCGFAQVRGERISDC
ncbi:carboxyl transferase domain-containing protein [Rhodopila sp.]|uniref:carboxyl transferase domain-containing protein n=1 Tax=Rhodopila sp. TaxID=2480087 RepID=UPI003D11CACE